MRTSQNILLLAALLSCPCAFAANPSNLQEVPESAPEPLGPMEDGQAIEPDVTIIQRKDSTVEEYRLSGRLYMVKITPVAGPSYYLVDQDGDGRLEARVGNLANQNPVIPNWVIFSW
ncbi:MAG: DUF2782 domain-containing protein [Gammaproteobacteria bacterium]|nr:DUF2782 domain-containing protein [Gammaproteobacteria bacterium]